MGTDQQLERWITEFVADQSHVEAMEAWVDLVYGRITAAVEEVTDDLALSACVRAACREHWRAFLANLGQPEQTFHFVQEARDVAMVAAQHGYPLTLIFQIYTAGEQGVWEFITSVVSEMSSDNAVVTSALIHYWTRSSAWFDASIEASVTQFQQEADRLRQGDAARRLEVVREVLAGTEINVREVSARLGGHPISAVQTALLLHTANDDAIADLPKAAQRLAQSVGLRQSLLVHPGGRDLWCWFGSTADLDLAQLRECEGWLAERDVVVAVGQPAPGLEGFRSSHRDALAAQRIALSAVAKPRITQYSDVELLSLIGNNAGMERFVERVLGRLAADDEQAARLRVTLHTFLSAGSIEAASKQLSVHKNTVRYRLERANDLMGRDVSSMPTEVELALRCHATFLEGRPAQ